MICIKRILPLILCLLLVSCSRPALKNPLAEKSAVGVFITDGVEYRVTVLNENGAVTSLVSKHEVQAAEIDELVEKTFQGSLPAFIAAFANHRRLTESEREELLRLIDGPADEPGKGGKKP